MAQFGAFAPFGVLTFGGDTTDADRAYQAMKANAQDVFDYTEGTHADASAYARALALASVRAFHRKGRAERRPKTATEMLPEHEKDYGVVPLPDHSDQDRRDALVAKTVICRGSRPEALNAALSALLGSDFYGVRLIRDGEAKTYPPTLGTVGTYTDPSYPNHVFTMLEPVGTVGEPLTVPYAEAVGDPSEVLAAEQVVTVEAENSGLIENIAVEAIGTDAVGRHTLTATFTKSHDVGATLNTYVPYGSTNRRRIIVAVSQAVTRNAVRLAQTYELLRSILKGTTLFQVYEVNSDAVGPWIVGEGIVGVTKIGPRFAWSNAGPFVVGESLVGVTPVGSAAFQLF